MKRRCQSENPQAIATTEASHDRVSTWELVDASLLHDVRQGHRRSRHQQALQRREEMSQVLPSIGSRWRLTDRSDGYVFTVRECVDQNGFPWFKLAYARRCDIDHIKPELIESFRCPGCVRIISPGTECESTITVELAWFEKRAKEVQGTK